METMLDTALALAVRVHAGQRDRYDRPRILHVLRVALRMPDEDGRVAAVLHDTVESGGVTLEELRTTFPPAIVEVVDRLSRRPGETYEDYIERAAADPLARRVKRADLADKLEPERLALIEDEERLARLHRAWCRLAGSNNKETRR